MTQSNNLHTDPAGGAVLPAHQAHNDAASAAALPMGGAAEVRAPALSWREGWRASALKARSGAAGCHLAISLSIAALVLLLVYRVWYAGPLAAVAGVGSILVLLLTVDVSLGPIMTFLVFDRRKKSLRMDLAIIGAVQILALAYGLHTVEAGRLHYLVFVKDRFEAVSRADLRPEDLQAAASNPQAARNWFGPAWVAVKPPSDSKHREDVLLESVLGGRDLQHFPQWYEPLANQEPAIREHALAIADLRRLNPGHEEVLDAALRKAGLSDQAAGYLPLKGVASDASVLVDRHSGRVLDILPLQPW
ncbi:MAG: TfpX/TfpZ family type IV pilin accessory protein [Lautropia sp.]|nr:TfpX/TfpZ family type IV pilin accessory protein [Lautropia sp.]